MLDRPLASLPLRLILLLALLPGCQAFHQYRPVSVQARDAETGQPIPAAEVHISYPLANPSMAPVLGSGTTQNDGIVHLRAAPYGELGIQVAVAAAGYMPEEMDVPIETVKAIEPAGWFETVENRPPSFVVSLYADPRPEVELIVPAMYRGIVKAEIQIQPDLRCPPRQRAFSYVVPPTGSVQIKGPPLLAHAFAPGFTLKYADGVPLNRSAEGSQIGYWWLRTEGKVECFFVGTAKEFSFQNPDRSEPKDPTRAHAGGRGQGGRGHGRRGGNQQPADAQPSGSP
jgi:hypothetical protein